MRVAARLDPDEVADVEHDAPVHGVGGEQLVRPRVVADAVDDRELRAGERARVGGGRLVVVRIGRRARDHARDVHAVAAELRGDAAPEVLRRDDLQDAAARAAPPAPSSAMPAPTTREHGEEQPDCASDPPIWTVRADYTLTILIPALVIDERRYR